MRRATTVLLVMAAGIAAPLRAGAATTPTSGATTTTTTPSTTTTTAPATTTTAPPTINIIKGAARIQQLEATIATDEQQSEILSQRYDADAASLQSLQLQILATDAHLAALHRSIDAAKAALSSAVINSYVMASPAASAINVFDGAQHADQRSEYESTVFGDLSQRVEDYALEQLAAAAALQKEQALKQQAAAQTAAEAALVAQNRTQAKQAQTALAAAKGKLKNQMLFVAIETAKLDAAKGDAAGAAAAIDIAGLIGGPSAAAAATLAADSVGTIAVTGTGTGDPQQTAAVAAAATQLGTPYVFGGETPKKGFDCSGLVQWAWAQAGVAIPRTTGEQWSTLDHVPLTSLEPGDLLYYFNLDGDQQVDHVVMYVGQGLYGADTVIAAAHTGTAVSYQPLFTSGLIGAARP